VSRLGGHISTMATPGSSCFEIEGKCLPQLLTAHAAVGRAGGHIEAKNATTIVGHYQKHVRTWQQMPSRISGTGTDSSVGTVA
jgi:hypothetical protein